MTRDRPEIDPRSTRDRPEIDPRSTQREAPLGGRLTQQGPKAPSLGDPSPPTPSVRVLRESPMGSGEGGATNEQGRLGRGGVHSEDCRPRRGFLPQGFTLRVRIGAARG